METIPFLTIQFTLNNAPLETLGAQIMATLQELIDDIAQLKIYVEEGHGIQQGQLRNIEEEVQQVLQLLNEGGGETPAKIQEARDLLGEVARNVQALNTSMADNTLKIQAIAPEAPPTPDPAPERD